MSKPKQPKQTLIIDSKKLRNLEISNLHKQQINLTVPVKSNRKPNLDDYDKGLRGHSEF